MIREVDIKDYFRTNAPLVDVRSPGEYEKGHIPGAVNISLFSDDERAHIGTVYVQQSKEKAMELGYKYVAPKLADFISKSKKAAPSGEIVIHCWRGGLRSRSFAQHLYDHGFPDVSVITGGYKAYRNHVLHTFDIPFDLKIVGGYTGSGKTFVIQQLRDRGLQVLDLEELARHKGSAFGNPDQLTQPSPEQFENNLFEQWRKLDYSKPIWLEDESHNIGGVNIPMNLFLQMRKSPVYFLDIPREERAKHLVEEYANAPVESLEESILRISKRLGGQNTRLALDYLHEKKFYEVAVLTLGYYDKSYLKGMRFHDQNKVFVIPGEDTNAVTNANAIITYHTQHERYKTHSI